MLYLFFGFDILSSHKFILLFFLYRIDTLNEYNIIDIIQCEIDISELNVCIHPHMNNPVTVAKSCKAHDDE